MNAGDLIHELNERFDNYFVTKGTLASLVAATESVFIPYANSQHTHIRNQVFDMILRARRDPQYQLRRIVTPIVVMDQVECAVREGYGQVFQDGVVDVLGELQQHTDVADVSDFQVEFVLQFGALSIVVSLFYGVETKESACRTLTP